ISAIFHKKRGRAAGEALRRTPSVAPCKHSSLEGKIANCFVAEARGKSSVFCNQLGLIRHNLILHDASSAQGPGP
ncbi:unnamed protein product, partial [Urochloa humidicola]